MRPATLALIRAFLSPLPRERIYQGRNQKHSKGKQKRVDTIPSIKGRSLQRAGGRQATAMERLSSSNRKAQLGLSLFTLTGNPKQATSPSTLHKWLRIKTLLSGKIQTDTRHEPWEPFPSVLYCMSLPPDPNSPLFFLAVLTSE